jgi:hypothetical protein
LRETAKLAPWGAKEMAVWRHALEIEGLTRSYLMFHALDIVVVDASLSAKWMLDGRIC